MAVLIKNKMLDEEAQNLYKELEGLDTKYFEEKPQNIESEEKNLDGQRLVLVEIVRLLSSYFLDTRVMEGIKNQKDYFADLVKNIEKLAQIPGHDGNFLISYRGYPTGTKISAEIDYVITLGDLKVDSSVADAIFNRAGVSMSHLQARLAKSFKVFSDHGINNLYLNINESSHNIYEHLRTSLSIISRYNYALKTSSPVIFEKKGQKVFLPLSLNEHGEPDLNLTMVAGLNSLKPQTMKSIVKQVYAYMQKSAGLHYMSIYDAISNIKNIKDKLLMPPVEVNNMKWLAIDKNQSVVSKQKAKVSRLVTQYYNASPQKAAKVMQTVYGDDYQQINSNHLGQRIETASELLENVTLGFESNDIEKEIFNNIQGRFKNIRDEIFDDLIVHKNTLTVKNNNEETIIGNIHTKLLKLINFHKKRVIANKKIKKISQKGIDFDAQDYQAIARDFGISVDNAKVLIKLLKSCFDNQGHFIKTIFEKHIPIFAKFEEKIFPFMWHYLKQILDQKDRIVFLNSLQMLIIKMQNPQSAIDILLSDILSNPDKVEFSDRNAFMLINLLMRTYNKELHIDIEVTPEEVLLVRHGLNKDLAQNISKKIDADSERYLSKIRAVHLKFIDELASDNNNETSAEMIKFLLYLEREAFIFFALAGGNTARSILRSAVKRYGDPDSQIYMISKSLEYIDVLMQHLTVSLRGLERLGNDEDIDILDQIKDQAKKFMNMPLNSKSITKVNRMLLWVDKVKKNIGLGLWKYLLVGN